MKRNRKRKAVEVGELPVAPLIDIVFLLLAYFMVSATIQKQEADLAFRLPAVVPQSETLEFPDEQIIEIDAREGASVNGYAYDPPNSTRFVKLAAMLSRYQQASAAAKTEAKVKIAPRDDVPHELVVKVMDACALAGVTSVSFALE